MRFTSGFLLILLPLLLLGGCDGYVGDTSVAALGTLERDRIELTADSNEPISGIFVKEGDEISVGDLLVTQDTSRAAIALRQAQAEERVARSILAEAEKGPRQQQISQARSRLQAANSAVGTLKIELDRVRSLLDRQLVAKNLVDTTEGKYDEAVAKQAEAEAALEELLEGTRSEIIDQARASHSAALSKVENLSLTLSRASIAAPVSATVEAINYEVGERPAAGTTVVVLLAEAPIYARIYVSSLQREGLEPGSPAEIMLDGYAEPIAGKLRWISSRVAFTPYFSLNQNDRSRLSYVAEVDVVDPSLTLPVGVPVEVHFK